MDYSLESQLFFIYGKNEFLMLDYTTLKDNFQKFNDSINTLLNKELIDPIDYEKPLSDLWSLSIQCNSIKKDIEKYIPEDLAIFHWVALKCLDSEFSKSKSLIEDLQSKIDQFHQERNIKIGKCHSLLKKNKYYFAEDESYNKNIYAYKSYVENIYYLNKSFCDKLKSLIDKLSSDVQNLKKLAKEFDDDRTEHLFVSEVKKYYSYFLDSETSNLSHQARKLLKPWKPNLTVDHWACMKETEEKAIDLAIKGELVSCVDESMEGYDNRLRNDMQDNKDLLYVVRAIFKDDELFGFDKIQALHISSLIDAIDLSNISLLYTLTLRGNIIRCNLFPELKPKFDEWLHEKGAPVSQEEQETIARRNAKEQRVWKNLQDEGLVDHDLQPICLELEEKAVLARAIATTLEIKHEWVYFGNLWHMDKESLRKAYSRKFEKKDGGDLLVKYQKITNI